MVKNNIRLDAKDAFARALAVQEEASHEAIVRNTHIATMLGVLGVAGFRAVATAASHMFGRWRHRQSLA